VYLCGFLKNNCFLSGPLILSRDVDLLIYETKGRQTLWKKCILTKFKSRLKFVDRLWLKGCFFYHEPTKIPEVLA